MARLVRLFKSDKGIWRYEIERDGEVRWTSLHTRNEKRAREKYDRLEKWLKPVRS
jgi:hypothetical protein